LNWLESYYLPQNIWSRPTSNSESPDAPLIPAQRWFPADEAMRVTAYEKLLPPLVAKGRNEVFAWRKGGYAGASATSRALLRWWFDTEQ